MFGQQHPAATYAYNEIPLMECDPCPSGVVIATTYVCRFHNVPVGCMTDTSGKFTSILFPASNVSICEFSMV